MDKKLSEQIQAVIDAMTLPETLAKGVMRTMREQRVSFGLLYSYPDEDIAQLINKLRYIRLLAENRELVE
jgi:hypothetical protein